MKAMQSHSKIYRQALHRGRRQSLASPPWAWFDRPGLCPTRLGWRTAGTGRSPVNANREAMLQANNSRKCHKANRRERLHLGVVHDNSLPRWELQSAVPLVGGHGLLILSLDWPKKKNNNIYKLEKR